jgi:hypothetical protein
MVRENRGLRNLTDTIRSAMADAYKKDFPSYVTSRPKRMSPEEKAQAEVLKEETRVKLKEQTVFDTKKELCDALKGEIIGDVCFFKNYAIAPGNVVEITTTSEPLESLSENYLNYQWRDLANQTGTPARVQIEKLLKEQN